MLHYFIACPVRGRNKDTTDLVTMRSDAATCHDCRARRADIVLARFEYRMLNV